ELSLMATISHPNIVKLMGFVEDMREGHAWIVLRWEANGNVREFLRSGEWDIPERISLIHDVVKGVEYLHSRQPPICHGDLKSLNILVDSSCHALITDFGSARIQRCLTLSDPGFSLRWTAPEVLDNGVQCIPSDMWAVGWICWEIMTGKFPFEELVAEPPIICRVVKGELPAIRDDAQLSQIKVLCSVMSDCWISNPVKR
ncbi:hypothetical protein M407DRAFT_44656, partial [Tulasnella calospora MUT 4182]